MYGRTRATLYPLALVLLALVLAACGGEGDGELREMEPLVERDLEEILGRDTLVALVSYNSTGYFVYRGEPMGYEYDLLREFADDNDLVLKVEVVRDRGELLDRLNRGDGDVGAARLVPEAEDLEQAAFTAGLYRTHPAIVQRTGPPVAAKVPPAADTILKEPGPAGLEPGPMTFRARLIRNPAELAGDTVWLPDNTAYLDRLMELSESLTGDIEIVEVDGALSPEAVIRRVARGDIGPTVTQANVAELSSSYYNNLAVAPALGPEHRVAWAVRKNSPRLLAALNEWIGDEKGEGRFEELYEKYFVDRRGYQERVESEYLTSETGRLSEFDPLFRHAAAELGWDWRLLASQAYQESRFKPTAKSWAGAVGLLQLMPGTARDVGVEDRTDPEENVAGAVRFLRDLRAHWAPRIEDPAEQLRFVLASYNVGVGHMEDAQRLTEKYGGNPESWHDVSYWLLQLSKRKYYSDPVVRYGFARGLEPVDYVARVLERFEHYREFVRPGAEGAAVPTAR